MERTPVFRRRSSRASCVSTFARRRTSAARSGVRRRISSERAGCSTLLFQRCSRLQRLTELVVVHRDRLDVWLRVAAVAAPALALSAGIVHYAITRDVAGVRFLALYVALMFLA